jgi:ubiquinone/menaquinone biosynthesis C-methylase UbiE
MSAPGRSRPPPYVLATGDAGASRLNLLHRVMEPGTSRALAAAGLGKGMTAVDVGCGIGTVTRQMGDIVGSSGRVNGVDAAEEQIEVARRESRSYERIGYTVATAYDTRLPKAAYDFAYARFVLCHLERPLDALIEMLSLLKPGGRLLCEDIEASSLASVPPTDPYLATARKSVEFGQRRGVDMDLGAKLPGVFQQLGLSDVHVTIWQPAFFKGEGKRFYEQTLMESMPFVLAYGATSREELEARIEAMRRVNDDESVLVVLPKVWQVWGRKP